MLSELQQRLSETYQLDHAHDVQDYVITDPTLAKLIGQDALLAGSDETLFIAEDEDGLALSLFLDSEMLDRLNVADPLNELKPGCLDDLWKVLEGISHFSCVAFKAGQDRKLSLLELELQGEVDKFVSSMRLALEQSETDLPKYLHGWLFDDVCYHDELDPEALDRSRAANDYAARFCHHLQSSLLESDEQAIAELRQFYRLPISDKISYIHSQAW